MVEVVQSYPLGSLKGAVALSLYNLAERYPYGIPQKRGGGLEGLEDIGGRLGIERVAVMHIYYVQP